MENLENMDLMSKIYKAVDTRFLTLSPYVQAMYTPDGDGNTFYTLSGFAEDVFCEMDNDGHGDETPMKTVYDYVFQMDMN